MNKIVFAALALAIIVLVSITGSARGVIIRLSLDGVNPAPDEIVVSPGDIIPMYVVSYTSGERYQRAISMVSPVTGPAIIENVYSLPAAGDIASVTDGTHPLVGNPSFTIYAFGLSADDSQGNILAGTHFAFDVRIDGDSLTGETRYLCLESPLFPDDIVAFKIVPEPATILLLGVGGLALLKRRG